MNSALIFAFTAGVVATVNPCGFALLPAWFAQQFAGKEGDSPARGIVTLTRRWAQRSVIVALSEEYSEYLKRCGFAWSDPKKP